MKTDTPPPHPATPSHAQTASTPFLGGLLAYGRSGVQPFHTPGHKLGRGAHPLLAQAMGDALRLDVSDVLTAPEYGDSWSQALAAAQARAAAVFGSGATRFVANGTTGALHAMLLAVRMLGTSEIVVARESHMAVLGGMILADLSSRYLPPERVAGWNLPLPPAPPAYEQALRTGFGEGAQRTGASSHSRRGPLTALLVTYPNYYGIATDLGAVVRAAHDRGVPVLVDEAHGPHYGFHPSLPPPALRLGADLVAQSTHKILGALTQASMLHMQGGAVPEALVDHALVWTQSTSPSGLLLASLDAAAAQMAESGERLWQHAVELAASLASEIETRCGMAVLAGRDVGAGYRLDPTRLVVRTSDRGLSGVWVASRLRELGVQVEMADPWHIVALVTWADTRESAAALPAALERICRDAQRPAITSPPVWPIPLPLQRLRPRDAAFAQRERIPLRRAVGRISAVSICPYPPGVPVLCPGEEIGPDVVEYLESVVAAAFEVRGTAQGDLQFLDVVVES